MTHPDTDLIREPTLEKIAAPVKPPPIVTVGVKTTWQQAVSMMLNLAMPYHAVHVQTMCGELTSRRVAWFNEYTVELELRNWYGTGGGFDLCSDSSEMVPLPFHLIDDDNVGYIDAWLYLSTFSRACAVATYIVSPVRFGRNAIGEQR